MGNLRLLPLQFDFSTCHSRSLKKMNWSDKNSIFRPDYPRYLPYNQFLGIADSTTIGYLGNLWNRIFLFNIRHKSIRCEQDVRDSTLRWESRLLFLQLLQCDGYYVNNKSCEVLTAPKKIIECKNTTMCSACKNRRGKVKTYGHDFLTVESTIPSCEAVMLLKYPNGQLFLAVFHNYLRTMASEIIDPIKWPLTPLFTGQYSLIAT